jgi:large subunit ribosomal protein L18
MERMTRIKKLRRIRKKRRLAKIVRGTDSKPRICVYKSTLHTYAQVISDQSSKTLLASSTLDADVAAKIAELPKDDVKTSSTKSTFAARAVGLVLCQKLMAAGIKEAVYDRNGFKYHGRVKSLADGIREGGFKI